MRREALYDGEVTLVPPTDASRALVRAAREAVVRELGSDFERAQFDLTPPDHFAAVSRARSAVAKLQDEAWAILASLGADEQAFALDVPRLRAILHEGHRIRAAAPAYYAHRDTWYANPRAQINVWIPLHDVRAEETFVIYPDALDVPVANDSGSFDWATFREEVGFQRANPPVTASYPRATEPLDRFTARPVEAREGEILLFSAAHLHEPRAHASGRTRFSVDFRVVHLGDHELGRGAPVVDVACKGSTLGSYQRRP